MARPKKNNADYFSHDSGMRNDEKIKALRRKYGLKGYAVWCMFLEKLTDCDGFEIKISFLAYELMGGDFEVDPDELKKILEYCIKIELLVVDDGVIYSLGLKSRLQGVLDKRDRGRGKAGTRKRNSDGEFVTDGNRNTKSAGVSVTDGPQSKVKESKVNKSKLNNTNTSITIKPKVFTEESFEYITSKYFLDFHIQEQTPSIIYLINSKGEQDILNKWSDEVRKLKEIDKYTEVQIKYIIDFTLQDDFWRNQIQSIEKFRKKKDGISYFIKMIDKAKENNKNNIPINKNTGTL